MMARASLCEGLWPNTWLRGDARIGILPPALDEKWFMGRFCIPDAPLTSPEDDPWPYLKPNCLALYDPLTALACYKGVRERYMNPHVQNVQGQGFEAHMKPLSAKSICTPA